MNRMLPVILVIIIGLCGAEIYSLNGRLKEALTAGAKSRSGKQERFAQYPPLFDGIAARFGRLDTELRGRAASFSDGDSRVILYREAAYLTYSISRSLNWCGDIVYMFGNSPEDFGKKYSLSRLNDLAGDIENNLQIAENMRGSQDPFIAGWAQKLQEYGREGQLLLTRVQEAVAAAKEAP